VRPILIGEFNTSAADPAYALWPEPAGSVGDHLCRIVLGLEKTRYVQLFERRNLLVGDRWSDRDAAEAAMELCWTHDRAPLVLLGARVARAFGVSFEPFTVVIREPWALCLPHPLDHWNELGSIERARASLSALYPAYARFAGSNRQRDPKEVGLG